MISPKFHLCFYLAQISPNGYYRGKVLLAFPRQADFAVVYGITPQVATLLGNAVFYNITELIIIHFKTLPYEDLTSRIFWKFFII